MICFVIIAMCVCVPFFTCLLPICLVCTSFSIVVVCACLLHVRIFCVCSTIVMLSVCLCVLMCVCCLSTLFVLTPPSSHYMLASTCLLPIHLVHAWFAIVALRACFLIICLVCTYFAIVTHMFTTRSPCSCMLQNCCMLVYYLFTLFVHTLPSSVFGHHTLGTKFLFIIATLCTCF